MNKILSIVLAIGLIGLLLNDAVAQQRRVMQQTAGNIGPEVTRPKNAPKSTRLPRQAITVPMKLVMNRPTVNVEINGKGPYLFVLDTGAGVCVLDPKLAEELELKSTGTTQIGDPSNPQAIEVDTYQLSNISVDEARFAEVSAVTWDAVNHLGVRGIIGLPTFYEAVIAMDFANQELTISGQVLEPNVDWTNYRAEQDGHVVVELDIAGHKIDGHIDSGNMGGITLPLALASKLNLESEPQVVGQGLVAGGSFKIYSAPFDGKVQLAGMPFPASTLTFNDRFEWANVGYQAFAENTMTIDQVNRRLQLKKSVVKNPGAKRQFQTAGGQPRYGVVMGMIGDGGMVVQQTVKGSIAESAGLKSGDKILKINGKEVLKLDAFGQATAFRKSPITLTIQRGDRELTVEMRFPDQDSGKK